MEECLTLLESRFRQTLHPLMPADENLRRLTDAYYQFCLDDPNYFRLHMFCSLTDVKSKVSVEKMEQVGLQCLKLCAEVIQKGIEEGLFNQTVDPWKGAAILWSASEGIISNFEMDPEKAKLFQLHVKELLNTNIELFIRGLKVV